MKRKDKQVFEILLLCFFVFLCSVKKNMVSKHYEVSQERKREPEVVVNVDDPSNDASLNRQKIQSALSTAKSTDSTVKVIIPDGVYHINGTIYIYSNTILVLGENTEIINDNGDSTKTLVAASNDMACVTSESLCDLETNGQYKQWKNISIEGGIWNLNSSDDNQMDIVGLKFNHGENLQIKNTIIENGTFSALNLSSSRNVTIDSVTFKNQITKKNSQISEYVYLGTAVENEKINNFPYDQTPIDNIIFQSCVFDNLYVGLGMHNGDSTKGKNLRIVNNTFTNIKTYGMNLFSFEDVVISNNNAIGSNGSYAFINTFNVSGQVSNGNIISNFEYDIVKSNPNSSNILYILDTNIEEDKVSNKFYYIDFLCDEDCHGDMTQNNKFIYSESQNIEMNKYERDGYEFAGWFAERESDGKWWCEDKNNTSENYYGEWCTEEQLNDSAGTYVKDKFIGNGGSISLGSSIHHDRIKLHARWWKIIDYKIFSYPTKLKYIQNVDDFDLSNGVIVVKVLREWCNEDDVNNNECIVEIEKEMTPDMVIGFSNKNLGPLNNLKIKYNTLKSINLYDENHPYEVVENEVVSVPSTGKSIFVQLIIGIILLLSGLFIYKYNLRDRQD